VGGGLFHDDALHLAQRLAQWRQRLYHPQAHIGGHLVVAAAARVQLARQRAHQFPQPALNGAMDILIARFRRELAALDIGGNARQSLQ